MLDQHLLLLYMIISCFPKYLTLKTNINHLIEADKLSVILYNLTTQILIVLIRKMDLYITTLQRLCLVYIVFKKKTITFVENLKYVLKS